MKANILIAYRNKGPSATTPSKGALLKGRRKGEVTPVDQTNVEGETPTDQVGVKEEDRGSRGVPKETS